MNLLLPKVLISYDDTSILDEVKDCAVTHIKRLSLSYQGKT